MIKILFVCHGNICRSPMAEFIMKDFVQKHGLDHIVVASAATSDEELGNPVHPGTRRKLNELGISCAGKVARRLTRGDYEDYDLLIGMDDYNLSNMLMLFRGDPKSKLHKLLSFCGETGDVADPWYTGDFDRACRDILRGVTALCSFLTSDAFKKENDYGKD